MTNLRHRSPRLTYPNGGYARHRSPLPHAIVAFEVLLRETADLLLLDIKIFRADKVRVGGKELPIGRNYKHEIQRLFKPSFP